MANAFFPQQSAELLSLEERNKVAAPTPEDIQLAKTPTGKLGAQKSILDTLNEQSTSGSDAGVMPGMVGGYDPQPEPVPEDLHSHEYQQEYPGQPGQFSPSQQYPQQPSQTPQQQQNNNWVSDQLRAKINAGEEFSYEEFSLQSDPRTQKDLIGRLASKLPTHSSTVSVSNMHPKAIFGLSRIQNIAAANGDVLLITSGNDSPGAHAVNSAHGHGEAADIRILKNTKDPRHKGSQSDEYSRSEEFARARKYAELAGFTSIRDELTVGSSPHSHISLSEGYTDRHNYVLNGSWSSKNTGNPDPPKTIAEAARRATQGVDLHPGRSKGNTKSFDQLDSMMSGGASAAAKTPPGKGSTPLETFGKLKNILGIKGEKRTYDLPGLVYKQATVQGLPSELLGALVQQESGGDMRAFNSGSQAMGLTQIIPGTLNELIAGEGVTYQDVANNPELQLKYGGRYLKKMLDQNKGNFAQALASYNRGPQGFKDEQAAGQFNSETLNYVSNIMSKIDPGYGGKPNTQRAFGQMMGTIPSPNLSEYTASIKNKQQAALQQDGLKTLSNWKSAITLATNPDIYRMDLMNRLFGSSEDVTGVRDYEAAARRHSKVNEAVDWAYSKIAGATPGTLRQTAEKWANDPNLDHPGKVFLGNLATSTAILEEFGKATVQGLNNIANPLFRKLGYNVEPGGAFDPTKLLNPGKQLLLSVSNPLGANLAQLSGVLPNSVDGMTDVQREILPTANGWTGFVSHMAPELAGMILSTGFWKNVFGAGAAIGPLSETAIASAGAKASSGTTSLLSKFLPTSWANTGSNITSGLVTAFLEHSPAIAADMASRHSSAYLARTLNPDDPESKLSDVDQLVNFFLAGGKGLAMGAMMSAGPAVMGSAYGSMVSSLGSVTRTTGAFGKFLSDPRLSPVVKGVAATQRFGSLGVTGGASMALIADMFGVDQAVLGRDVHWAEMMGIGAVAGWGGGAGLTAAAIKNPKWLYTQTAMANEALGPMREYVTSFASPELLAELKRQYVESATPFYKEQYKANILEMAAQAEGAIAERLDLVNKAQEKVGVIDQQIGTLKQVAQNAELQMSQLDIGITRQAKEGFQPLNQAPEPNLTQAPLQPKFPGESPEGSANRLNNREANLRTEQSLSGQKTITGGALDSGVDPAQNPFEKSGYAKVDILTPREAAEELGSMQEYLTAKEKQQEAIAQARLARPTKELNQLYESGKSEIRELKKEMLEYEKNNPGARKFLSLQKSQARLKYQIDELTKARELVAKQAADQAYVAEVTKENFNSWKERSLKVVEDHPELVERAAAGDLEALIDTMMAEHASYDYFVGDLANPSDRIFNMQNVLTETAFAQVRKIREPHNSAFGKLVHAALADQGISLQEVQDVYFPDQGLMQNWKETKNGIYRGTQAAEIIRESPLNWGAATRNSGVNALAAAPSAVLRHLEREFPQLNLKNSSLPGIADEQSPLDFGKLKTGTAEEQAIHAEKAYASARLALELGEAGVPVIAPRGAGRAKLLNQSVGGKGVAEFDEIRESLQPRHVELGGAEEFGITNSHDLFDLSATASEIQRKASDTLVNGAKYSIKDGKMIFPNGDKLGVEEFTQDVLMALAGNIKDIQISPEGIAKVFTDRMNFEMAQSQTMGSDFGQYTPAVTEVGIQAIAHGDLEGASAMASLIKNDTLSDSDRYSYKLTSLQETMGLREANMETVLGRVLDSHQPIRDEMVNSLASSVPDFNEGPALDRRQSTTQASFSPSEKVITDFDLDGMDLISGKLSVGNWLEKYGKGKNSEVARKYVRSLVEMNQLANTIARRSKNSQNLFSSHVADIFYKDYLPEEFNARKEYAKSTRVGTFLESSNWDLQDPRKMREGVNQSYAELQGHLVRHEALGRKEFGFLDPRNPKKFCKGSLAERMEVLEGLNKEQQEALSLSDPNKYLEKVSRVEKLTFSPFLKDVTVDPMIFAAKKLKGAVTANNLGDFIQAGTMLEKQTAAGNPMKVAIVSETKEGPAGYVSLSEGVSESYQESKLQFSDGTSSEGSRIWVLPEFREALDNAFGFNNPKMWTGAGKRNIPAWKDALAGIRALALISGAPSYAAQLMGKGLSLMGAEGYRALSKLTGREMGPREVIGTAEQILTGSDAELLAIREHAHGAGLNLSEVRKLSSSYTDYQLRNMTAEQQLEAAKVKVQNYSGPARALKLIIEAGKVENPLANVQSDLLKQEFGPIVSFLGDAYKGITLYDNLEMIHSVNHASDQAALSAFMVLEQQLSASLGPQLAHLPAGEAKAAVSKTAAAIVNKNMGTLPQFLGSSVVQKFFQEMYTTPGIQYSRLQNTIEVLDTLYSAIGKKHQLKSWLSKNLGVGDHYGHYPELVKDQLKTNTHSSLGRLVVQAGLVSILGNYLINGNDATQNPPGRKFAIKMGDNEYYNMPGFLGGVKSTIRFWDDLYGRTQEGEGWVLGGIQSLAENESMKQNWLARFLIEGSNAGKIYTQDQLHYAISDFLLQGATGLGEVYGARRGGHPIDALNPAKIGTDEGAAARNTPKAQLLKDATGMAQQIDPSLNYTRNARLPEKSQRKEMMKRADGLARVLATLDPESEEYQNIYQKGLEEMIYDMGEHPNDVVRDNYNASNVKTKERVINYTKNFRSLISKYRNDEEFRSKLKGPGSERAQSYR